MLRIARRNHFANRARLSPPRMVDARADVDDRAGRAPSQSKPDGLLERIALELVHCREYD